MKLKDAIEVLTDHVRDCPAKPVCYNCQAHNLVIAELRKAKREKREAWKAFCRDCKHRQGFLCIEHNTVRANFRNCPAIKRGKGNS